MADAKQPPAVRKKRKVGYALAQAIMAIHERKKISHFCDYRAVSARFNINWRGLKAAYSRWVHGHIDLGVITQTPGEKAIDMRAQHAKTLELVNRHFALLLAHYEGALFTAENKTRKQGKDIRQKIVPTEPLSKKGELVFLSRELLKVLGLRTVVERGYDSFLETIEAARRDKEKVLKPNPDHPAPIEVQAHVITSESERRALDALNGHGS